jgi:hypothetical protein
LWVTNRRARHILFLLLFPHNCRCAATDHSLKVHQQSNENKIWPMSQFNAECLRPEHCYSWLEWWKHNIMTINMSTHHSKTRFQKECTYLTK